jgi:hypothetical protein
MLGLHELSRGGHRARMRVALHKPRRRVLGVVALWGLSGRLGLGRPRAEATPPHTPRSERMCTPPAVRPHHHPNAALRLPSAEVAPVADGAVKSCDGAACRVAPLHEASAAGLGRATPGEVRVWQRRAGWATGKSPALRAVRASRQRQNPRRGHPLLRKEGMRASPSAVVSAMGLLG